VVKTCLVPTPVPTPGAFSCSNLKPIDSLTMIWNGTQDVKIKAWSGAIGSSTLMNASTWNTTIIKPGDEVTISGYATNGSGNDVIWEIFDAGTGLKIGASDFHKSCSDVDMDGPEDCGKPEGDARA